MTEDRKSFESIVQRVRALQDDALHDPRRRAAVRRRLLDPSARARPAAWTWFLLPASVAAIVVLAFALRPAERIREARRAIGEDPDTSFDRTSAPRAGATPATPTDDVVARDARRPARPAAPEARRPTAEAPVAPVAPETQAPAAPISEWKRLAEAAEYESAMAAARREGLEAIVAAGTSEELLLLGRVAQRAGAPEAAAVYRALRERYRATEAAATAAFMLGRIAASAGDVREAATWFEAYLSERPFGTHARDALGRLIEARVALDDAAEARRAARTYLERYPRGPHAPLAERVIATP